MSPKRRIFTPRYRYRSHTLAFIAVVMLALVAACAPEASHWSSQQKVKRNEVRWITFEHDVRFDRGSAGLGDTERTRLHRFLARHDAGYGDTLLIGSRGNRVGGEDIRRAGRRESMVAAEIRTLKLPAGLLPDVPSRETWDGSVKVVLGRYVVIPPKCPDWSKRADGDSANQVSSNFGCANITNLGLMVANPGDLVRGRTAGPADGSIGARRYKAYREGEQKKSPAITPLVIQSSVGGGTK
jgi:pilus assembly protein CpaD